MDELDVLEVQRKGSVAESFEANQDRFLLEVECCREETLASSSSLEDTSLQVVDMEEVGSSDSVLVSANLRSTEASQDEDREMLELEEVGRTFEVESYEEKAEVGPEAEELQLWTILHLNLKKVVKDAKLQISEQILAPTDSSRKSFSTRWLPDET